MPVFPRHGSLSVWRKRRDGRPNAGEVQALLMGAAPGCPAPAPAPQFGQHPSPGLREKLLREQRERGEEVKGDGAGDPLPDCWWARNTNRRASRGSKWRPIPRTGHVAVEDAPAMLDALATRKAKKVARSRAWYRCRVLAIFAVVAGLAVTGQVEEVLGTVARRRWLRLCSMTPFQVEMLRLPAISVWFLRRWLRWRSPLGVSQPWVAWLDSPVQSRDARERLGMVCAREAWRIMGRPVRPAALLRWRGPCPERFQSARQRRAWAG